ncbi:hypothetical protein C8R43DRAFT_74505 [Mycena crocata]|nr:hypothetical protein C8R43DRAFT_74505 [Mycena crocata]
MACQKLVVIATMFSRLRTFCPSDSTSWQRAAPMRSTLLKFLPRIWRNFNSSFGRPPNTIASPLCTVHAQRLAARRRIAPPRQF